MLAYWILALQSLNEIISHTDALEMLHYIVFSSSYSASGSPVSELLNANQVRPLLPSLDLTYQSNNGPLFSFSQPHFEVLRESLGSVFLAIQLRHGFFFPFVAYL